MSEIDRQNDRQPSPITVIKSIFEEFNLTGVTDDVFVRVLDIIYKYCGEILQDANAMANYSGRPAINEADVRLAIESNSDNLILTPLHREQLLEYADKVNAQPLPAIRFGQGIRLGPEKCTLTAPNFCIIPNAASTIPVDNNHFKPLSSVSSSLGISGTNPGLTVYRVGNSASGNHIPSLISHSGDTGDFFPTTSASNNSGLHVVAPGAAPASLIRVQSSNFVQGASVLPISRSHASNTNNSLNLHR